MKSSIQLNRCAVCWSTLYDYITNNKIQFANFSFYPLSFNLSIATLTFSASYNFLSLSLDIFRFSVYHLLLLPILLHSLQNYS
jgi:hypothetical protein